MKFLQIIALILLISTVYSDSAQFETCAGTCVTDNCTGNNCDSVFESFPDLVLTFGEQACTNFIYTKVTPTTNSELATQLANCLDAYAATQSGELTAFAQCMSDCVLAEDTEYDGFLFEDDFDDFEPGHICFLQTVQTSSTCRYDNACGQTLKYDLRQVEIENELSECEYMRLNYSQSDAQFSQSISDCYQSMAQAMSDENVLNPNTYSGDLIHIALGISACIDQNSYDMSGLVTSQDEPIPNQDCKANFCLSEFDTCQEQCAQQCVTSDCFSDTTDGYISYYPESECQTALQQITQLKKDQDYIDTAFQTSYLNCIEQLETTYASNSKVLGYLTCQKACKDKKPVEEEKKEDSAQVLLIGSCLASLFLIL